MLKVFKSVDFKKTGIFAAGVLFGTAGIKVLGSKDAKKVYTGCTAAVLRAKECVMKAATTIQENAEDIYAEAQQINEERAAKEEIFEVLAGLFKKETEKREEQIEQTSQKLQYAFDFLELVFGEGQELVLFVTELNTNPYSVSFISENGCDSYYKYNKKLLFEEEQGEILKELNQIEEEM